MCKDCNSVHYTAHDDGNNTPVTGWCGCNDTRPCVLVFITVQQAEQIRAVRNEIDPQLLKDLGPILQSVTTAWGNPRKMRLPIENELYVKLLFDAMGALQGLNNFMEGHN